jgi:uncharacterized protein YukE
MSKAVVDPAELRRFAQDLKRFNSGLLTQMAVVQSRLNDLSQSWRDQEHKKFVEEFDTTMKALARYAEATDKHIPFLLRKAEKIEEYLNQR